MKINLNALRPKIDWGRVTYVLRQNIYDESKHPRDSKGTSTGGQWTGGSGVTRQKGSDKILHLLRTQGDGFTYRPVSDSSPTSGFMSSIEDGPIFPPDASDEEALALIDEFLVSKAGVLGGKDMYVGGWLNGEDGQFYLDASQNFQSLDDAIYSAADTKQKAIFDLNTFTEIRIGDYLIKNPGAKVPAGARDWYTAHPKH